MVGPLLLSLTKAEKEEKRANNNMKVIIEQSFNNVANIRKACWLMAELVPKCHEYPKSGDIKSV